MKSFFSVIILFNISFIYALDSTSSLPLDVTTEGIDEPKILKRSLKIKTSNEYRTFKRSSGYADIDAIKNEMSFAAKKYEFNLATIAFNTLNEVTSTLTKGLIPIRQVKVKKDVGSNQEMVKRGGESGVTPLIDQISSTTGADISYYGSILMGSANQKVAVLFDTGSSDLWVPLVPCSGCKAGIFQSSKSNTFFNSSEPFIINYGSGSVKGTLATETISIAGLVVTGQKFGAVTKQTSAFASTPFSGILGLGFQKLSVSNSPTPIDNLVSRGLLSQDIFGFYLTRGQSTGSELSIGSIDHSHIDGEITYTPVVSKSYWEVQANQPVVNGQSVGSQYLAAIDTGTTLVLVPKSIASAIYAAIPGASYDKVDSSGTQDLYQFPCNSQFTVGLTFGGSNKVYNINLKDFNLGFASNSNNGDFCVGGIMGQDMPDQNGDNFAIIGDEFLKSWYSIYDYNFDGKGNAAVGFAASK